MAVLLLSAANLKTPSVEISRLLAVFRPVPAEAREAVHSR